ncbi:hypothetical protein Scep_015945 [Stephania cephalantha]|uniref:NAC domain-containing protein n=1 Tax=Stephania cephalantha TaxID=152367 RepID=A0AAP0ILY2_9MAGN
MFDPIDCWCLLLTFMCIGGVFGGGSGDGAGKEEGGEGIKLDNAMVEFDNAMVPTGYKFLPTDDELVRHYLLNKVCEKEILAPDISNMSVDQFYSISPEELAETGKKEVFFFIHCKSKQEQNFGRLRTVKDDKGVWLQKKEEKKNLDDNIFSLKKQFRFFKRKLSGIERTCWVLEEYQVRCKHHLHNEVGSLHNIYDIFIESQPPTSYVIKLLGYPID